VALDVGTALVLVNLVLLAGGLVLFLPARGYPTTPRDARRLLSKYGRYLLVALFVLALHLTLVALDEPFRSALGLTDLAPAIERFENGFVLSLSQYWSPLGNLFFSFVYIVLHPFMIAFGAILFVVSDEERAAKAVLLSYPLAYGLALPFYLFWPATNVYQFYGIPTPLFDLFPEFSSIYYQATTPDNTFPSLHVAMAVLIANATRYSRNRPFRVFAWLYAASVVAGTMYLAIHWATDVAGGLVLAVVVAGLTGRVLSLERVALQRLRPDPEEAHAIAADGEAIVEHVTSVARDLGLDARPMLVGSVAKDTYLKDKVDFDVFVLFPPSTPRETLEKSGLALGHRALPDGIEKYAEHPYVHGTWRGRHADVVPCFAVDDPSKRLSAVDRTPFHTRFVLERMEREQRDQVRLLKQFCRAVGVYGAEARVRGFSGYLCELLVLKYHTFQGVAKAASSWRPGTFLTLETLEGNPRFPDPLVFLDPVDLKRNAASAVSDETLELFAEACRAYLDRPGLTHFFPKRLVPLTPDALALEVRRRRATLVLVTFERPPDVLEDHLHDQLRKAANALSALLARHDFQVRRATTDLGLDARVLVEVPQGRLPESVEHVGPPLTAGVHASRFRETWGDHPDALSAVYEQDGRLKVLRRREYRDAADLLRAKMREVDLGKHLTPLAPRAKVEAGPKVVREDTAALVTRHVTRLKPWER